MSRRSLLVLVSLFLAGSALRGQLTDPIAAGEKLSIAHFESGNSETPHLYEVGFRSRLGRLYVVEETEDLAQPRWRRLPLLVVGNEEPGGLIYNGPGWYGEDTYRTMMLPSELAFEASGDRQFVRLRYVENALDPLRGDYDRDGVSNLDEVNGAQTDPFGYPDEDATDIDADDLPDAWERYRFGTLDFAGTDLLPSGLTYAALYAAQRRDTDGDGLPDDWEMFRCEGSLAEGPTTLRDGKTNLARYREDRVKLAGHRFGAQVFSYHASLATNAFGSTPDNPLKVYMLGNQGGSMIVTYADATYAEISHVRVWPSNDDYGVINSQFPDPAVHYADYTGTLVNGAYEYTFSTTPATGDYVARDLLKSLHGQPLVRTVSGGVTQLSFAPLAITSLPVTAVGPESAPAILRDFPYESVTFPEFGGPLRIGSFWQSTGWVSAQLEEGPLVGLPRLSSVFYDYYPQDSGQRFAAWFTHADAFGFNLERQSSGGDSGFGAVDDFFPHQNDVGSVLGNIKNRQAFTTELHFRLDYTSLEDTWLEFSHDDDLWVYIDGQLVHDGGGVFVPPRGGGGFLQDWRQVVKDREGTETPFLEATSGSCMVDVFHAERATAGATLEVKSSGTLHPIYAYQVVVDADLPTALTFSLTQAPPGMIIDSRTGRILWDYLPLNRDTDPGNNVAAGAHTVTVSVTDARGHSASQSFTLNLQLP